MDNLFVLIFGVVCATFLAGVYGERWRARRARRQWRNKRPTTAERNQFAFGRTPDVAATDPAAQLRLVMAASFAKRRILSKSEARVFHAAEKAINDHGLTWRVMAQVCLGEVLSSPDARAYSAINSKRVDVLLVSSVGDPIAAIEYQGSGHYQGTASARDAVKKEALRRAGVRYIELTPEHAPKDLVQEISRIVTLETKKGLAL